MHNWPTYNLISNSVGKKASKFQILSLIFMQCKCTGDVNNTYCIFEKLFSEKALFNK